MLHTQTRGVSTAKTVFPAKVFSLQVEVLNPKGHMGLTQCPFFPKGNALCLLCQLKSGGSQTGNVWRLWPKAILLVKYSIQCLWLPFAQEAALPGYTIGDPTVTCRDRSPEESALCQHKPICYSSRALSSHLACPSLTMMPSSRERTRGLIKNKDDLSFFDMSKSFISSFLQHYFSYTLQWKIALMVFFFFFSPTSFSSLFLLSVVVYNKAFYII